MASHVVGAKSINVTVAGRGGAGAVCYKLYMINQSVNKHCKDDQSIVTAVNRERYDR